MLNYVNRNVIMNKMVNETVGETIKRIRTSRKLSQRKLSILSGVDRAYINQLEHGKRARITIVTAKKLAKGLDVEAQEFLKTVTVGESSIPPQTVEDLLEKLRLAQPITVPVYSDFSAHAGRSVDPIDYVYLARPKTPPKGIEGIIVEGDCLEPLIDDGDIIIVDRNAEVDPGDIVLCMMDSELFLGKYVIIRNQAWLENKYGKRKMKDFQSVAVVIESIKKIKGHSHKFQK